MNAHSGDRDDTTVVLRAEGLYKSFGRGALKRPVLTHVSLELVRGEFVLLMGPSGSGKSTLLSILSGLLSPDEGTVRVLGQDLWSLSDRRRERVRLEHFGFVFQGHNLFPALTATQQLAISLRWGSATRRVEATSRAVKMLELLGLADKMHLRPAQLSGGEKQRVCVGRALVKRPALCFADEPTSSLDWEHGRGVLHLLRDAAHRRDATVLVVSHDDRVIPLADRVLRIRDGFLTASERQINV